MRQLSQLINAGYASIIFVNHRFNISPFDMLMTLKKGA
jgi:hypothetical protein